MNRPKVLIVEDDQELRRMYKEIFEHNRFEVEEASDGELAVDQALITKPDVIVLDIMMPKQGGLGALRILQSLPETKSIPVFIMTAMAEPKYEQIASGRVVGYFHKSTMPPQQMVRQVKFFLDSGS